MFVLDPASKRVLAPHMTTTPASPSSSSWDAPVRSVARAIDVLLAVSNGNRTLGGITAEVGLSKATVHRLLAALAHHSMIVQDPVTGDYLLGPGSIRLSESGIRGAGSFGTIARPLLQGLCDATSETVTLHVRVAQFRVCIAEVQSPLPVRFTSGIGVAEPTYTGSAGKALLAFTPADVRETLLSQIQLRAVTENTITNRALLEEELARVVERGYAQSHGERVSGATGISAPVFDRDDAIVAAVSILGPSDRMPLSKINEFIPALMHYAQAITARLAAETVH